MRVIVPPFDGFDVVVRVNDVVDAAKLAVTVLLAFMVTVTDVEVPVAAPLQLEKIKPVAGTAVNVTTVPFA